MQRNIIVHHVRRKPQEESLTSLIKDEPVKPPTSKTSQDIQMESVFDELELGMEMNTSSKFSQG
jgi:hypothetical protein